MRIIKNKLDQKLGMTWTPIVLPWKILIYSQSQNSICEERVCLHALTNGQYW